MARITTQPLPRSGPMPLWNPPRAGGVVPLDLGQPVPPVPVPQATPARAADPSGIDALYKQYGITDGGRGSGFADRAYWLEHPSEIANGRLGRDLAGTGTDEWTGTPGQGPWQSSGAHNAPGSPTAGAGIRNALISQLDAGPMATPATPDAMPVPGLDAGGFDPTDDVAKRHRDALLAQLQG